MPRGCAGVLPNLSHQDARIFPNALRRSGEVSHSPPVHGKAVQFCSAARRTCDSGPQLREIDRRARKISPLQRAEAGVDASAEIEGKRSAAVAGEISRDSFAFQPTFAEF